MESLTLGELFEKYKDEKEIIIKNKEGSIEVYPQAKKMRGSTKAKYLQQRGDDDGR